MANPEEQTSPTPDAGDDNPRPGLTSPATKAAARKAAAAKAAAEAEASPKHTPKKVVNAKAAARSGDPKKRASAVEEQSRYTPPTPNSFKVSPWYIPALMFGFLGIGMLVIFFNYISWPFGSPSNWRLLIGLVAILAGILTATRYQ